jgi:hypothetical protein
MPAFRAVVSVLLRALGDFSLHPQGQPADGRLRRPSSAGTGIPIPARVLNRRPLTGQRWRRAPPAPP